MFQLNDLQWLNALDNIYYDNDQKHSEIIRGIQGNVKKRNTEKSLLNEYPGEPRNDGKESILLHMHKPDIKIGLKLQSVKQIREITDNELYDGSKSVRDLHFIKIHREFLSLVDKGQYNMSEFGKYLRELS